jgi:uncharacterized protein YdeI (YjbR/CyaY-like superfamily)
MYFRMKQILQEKSNTFENIIDTNNIFKINNTDIQSKKILKYFSSDEDKEKMLDNEDISETIILSEIKYIFAKNPSLEKIWDKLPDHHKRQFIIWMKSSQDEDVLQERLENFIKIFSQRLNISI